MNAHSIRALIGAAILSTSVATAASAQEVRIRVRADDLSTLSGQKAVLASFERASVRACAGGSLQDYMDRKHCRAELMGNLVRNINHPGMTALYKGNTVLVSR